MLLKIKTQIYPNFRPEKIQASGRLLLAEGPKLVAELLAEKRAAVSEIFALKNGLHRMSH